ncbi:DUF1642 domain-containing protein [Streptococcus uberis]|uniref:DUF1642 domain-containing protein n=1 Tax=Streptococcus uberis TaxID=1349 RepID=UPI00214FF729|nr:DUF1642 domain-containing protein [Streptococcus uberis]MCR4258765.1 DUF1642 domain-containing protein [Streptococcus uberis]
MKIENKKAYIPCEIVENQINNGLDIRVRIDKTHDLYINRKLLIPDIDQPKQVVSQVAIDYYEQYKDTLSSFDEWFCGFYDNEFEAEFERADELRRWLHHNDNKINLQRELALATLIVNGPDAVEVEKEKLYTVEIPNPNEGQLSFVLMRKPGGNISINVVHSSNLDLLKTDKDLQLTEQEIRKDFDWAWQWKKEVTE